MLLEEVFITGSPSFSSLCAFPYFFLIEVHKSQVYSLINLKMCTHPYNHHLIPTIEHFYPLSTFLCVPSLSIPAQANYYSDLYFVNFHLYLLVLIDRLVN